MDSGEARYWIATKSRNFRAKYERRLAEINSALPAAHFLPSYSSFTLEETRTSKHARRTSRRSQTEPTAKKPHQVAQGLQELQAAASQGKLSLLESNTKQTCCHDGVSIADHFYYPLQCDESRPQCQKCVNYGVQCNYNNDGGDELQLRGEGAMVFTSVPHSMGPGLGPTVPKDSMSPESDDGKLDQLIDTPLTLHSTRELYYLTQEDVDVLRMFRSSTVFTIGTAQSVGTYQTEIVNLMFNVRLRLALGG